MAVSAPAPLNTTIRFPASLNYRDELRTFAHARSSQIRLRPEEVDSITISTFADVRRFKIPTASTATAIDGNSIRLVFDATCTRSSGTATDGPRFPNDIRTLISYGIFRLGSAEINRAEAFSVKVNIDNLFDQPDAVQNDNLGIAPPALRDDWAAGRRYEIPINTISTVFQDRLFPLHKTGKWNAQWQIEIAFRPASEVLEGTGTLTYTLSNIELHYNVLQMTNDADVAAFNSLLAGAAEIHFTAYDHYLSTISSTSNHFVIPVHRGSIRYILGVFREQANLTDVTVNDKNSKFEIGNLTSYFAKIRGRVVPDEPIEYDHSNSYPSGSELLKHVKSVFDANYDINSRKHAIWLQERQINDSSDPRFIVAIDLSGFKQRGHQAIISGEDLAANANNNLVIITNHSSVPSPTQQVDWFIGYDAILKVEGGRAYTLDAGSGERV